MLVDHTSPTELHQLTGLIKGDLFLELITRKPSVNTLRLNCQIGLIVTHAHAHRSTLGLDIPLLNMGKRKGGASVSTAFPHKEFPFYFHSAHATIVKV